ncbi:hypothetical protein VCRA2120E331_260086 [Vibrio crassostreae]|nr:hypothetical protein VCRA2120E331_260086 [Vibrio crassostreae]CAK3377161.1 hypothetical protein VCRA2127O345_260086 [Vibrio crassostreae]CAK3383052.1 hypothetical protein VCRA2120E330_250086 [Vibrio crassostreae]
MFDFFVIAKSLYIVVIVVFLLLFLPSTGIVTPKKKTLQGIDFTVIITNNISP